MTLTPGEMVGRSTRLYLADPQGSTRQIHNKVLGRSTTRPSADPQRNPRQIHNVARLLGLHTLPDALPGRSETIELFPLSQGEISGAPDRFIDAAFSHGHRIPVTESGLRRRDYLALAAAEDIRSRSAGPPNADVSSSPAPTSTTS